ncbi:hypothetical protein LTR17_010471 [Elasticomyces elasticus]|nr:hypothetical protein LTR17_010471 [Elasticomyces elasticus]
MEISFTMSILALVATTLAAPTTLVARASTHCAEGEVGVGRTQLCNLGSPGQEAHMEVGGKIFANDCGYIAGTVSTDSSGYCGGKVYQVAFSTLSANHSNSELVKWCER